jgi:hypothetical protein
MLTIQNQHFILLCAENGDGLTLIDKQRWTRWALDYQTLVAGKDAWGDLGDLRKVEQHRLFPYEAEAQEESLRLSMRAGEIPAALSFRLCEDYLEVTLPASLPDEIGFLSLPGSFSPERERLKILLPIMQGMLWDGKGPEFSNLRGEAGHLGFSMPFLGYLGESGGLLVTAETRDDLLWWHGKEKAGRFWAANLQIGSLGSMRYDRSLRIYSTDADLVSIAKRYRRKVVEARRFKRWEEKIEERPSLERLFGALMCFIGYCQDDLDYAAECKKLKAYGFDRALVYPGRFNMVSNDIRMGGVPAIDLPAGQVEAIKALGYDIAPWSWLNEGLDDGTLRIHRMFRKTPEGLNSPHWAIDDQQWYHVCYSFLAENQQKALEQSIPDMTWDHFDVLSCVPAIECYASDHPQHAGRPMSRAESKEWVRRAFRLDQAAGRMVSSENFNDAFSLDYDLGSVKAWPQYGPWPFWPVPLTMLVYHDSLIHSWWEVHSYNNAYFGRTAAPRFFEYGGGRPKLQAALDALLGCPPDVFPFGAQYSYTGRGKETFLYKFRFEDPEVQIALREALPIARLHRRIGKCEMVHFKFLSEDGYVQETAFSDGTHVVANFGRDFAGNAAGVDPSVMKKVGWLGPESWKTIS